MTQRGVRVVEGARLESVYAGNRIESSNLFLSASVESVYAGNRIETGVAHDFESLPLCHLFNDYN